MPPISNLNSSLFVGREARRRRKEEKKRRKLEARNDNVDIYDRMIGDDPNAQLGDDPNARLGQMDQEEFEHYLQKYGNANHPQRPQHLKVSKHHKGHKAHEHKHKPKDN